MSFRLLLAALAALTLPSAFALAQSNDNFSDRIPLNGASATVVSNNTKATLEPGEPNHAGQSFGRSLWWTWKAPSSGTVNLSVFDGGSVSDPIRHTLAIYTGNALDNLSQVAATGGATPLNAAASSSVSTSVADYSVSFQAVSGTDYQIAVDDYAVASSGSDATVVLSVNQAPVIVSQVTASATAKSSFSYSIQASNQPVSYAASGLPSGLTLNPDTGNINGIPTAAGAYPIQLSAANPGGTGTAVLTLTVNEASASSSSSSAAVAPPTFSGAASAAGTVGAPFTLNVSISNASSGTSGVSGLPPGLQYDAFFNQIVGTPITSGVYPVTFGASNAAGSLKAVTTIAIAAQANLPIITSAIAVQATVGNSFSYTIASQSYDSSVNTAYGAANLPPGLGLNPSSGVIGGAPTTPGVYAVPISVTNAAGTSQAVVTITVASPVASATNAPPFFNGSAILSLQVNSSVSSLLSVSNAPTSFTASNLPPGLSLNPANGYLVGTPTTLGEYLVPISATNTYGTTGVTLTIRVISTIPNSSTFTSAANYLVGSAAAANATAGSAFSYTIALSTLSSSTTSSTPPPYLYAYTASGLPGGLSLNVATGVISGTPAAAGTYSIDLGCVYYPDSTSKATGLVTSRVQTPPATLTLVVAPVAPAVSAPPLIVSAASASGAVNKSFSYVASASNGPTSYTASGLPPGLSINAASGAISGLPTAAGSYAVSLTASNAVGLGGAVVTLVIGDAASAAQALPQITAYAYASGTVGQSFSSFYVSGTNSPTSYTASNLPPGLSMNASTGTVTGTPTTAGDYSITLSATNAAGTATAPLVIHIAQPSPPAISSGLAATGVVGSAFSYLIYTSYSTFSVSGYDASNLPPGLTINTATGVISGTPTAAGTYAVPISAANVAGTSAATVTISISATPAAPAISGKAVYNGTVGQSFSYSITPSSASGGYTAAGLPGGLLLNASTGVISGTPTAAGAFTVPISAANAGGTTNATVTFAIAASVGAGLAAPVISSPAAGYGKVGAPYSYQITATNSPTSFDAGSLPPGLSFNSTTGLISGTPTAAGTYAVNVSAFNASASASSVAQVTMTFSGATLAAPVISSPALFNAFVNEPFSYQITASDYPTSFTATGLPIGLTLNPTTGLISGTPTQTGFSTVTLSATNALGVSSARLSLTIGAVPNSQYRITSPAAAVGVVGTSFSYTVTGNFSTTSYPLIYASSTGLPPGLTFSASTARLSGTPTASGNYDVTFSNNYTSAVVRIAILASSNANSAAPVFTNAAGINAYVGEPFSFALSATNNPASLSATNLPAGLSFNAAVGIISGTPSQAANASAVPLSASNGAGAGAGAATLTIHVLSASSAPLRVTGPAAQSGVIGLPFSYKPAASAQASYYNSSGSLPAGLILNSSTGEISGTPTAVGTFTPIIQLYSSTYGYAYLYPTLIILGAPNLPSAVSSAAGAVGAVGSPFSYALAATNLPTGFSVGSLPAGLAFSAAASTISGTPTATGRFPVPVTVVNGVGQSSATLTFDIAALPPPPTLTSSDLAASATVGFSTVIYRISAANNPTGYGASNLPPGLSVDPINGVISGTPTTPGVYPVTISAANASGSASAVATLTINASSAPAFYSGTAAAVAGAVGSSFSSSLSTTGLPSSYTASGVPPGVYFDPYTGRFSGVPTTPGAYPVFCTVSNAVGTSAATLTIVVSPPAPPTLPYLDSIAYLTVGSLYSDSFFNSTATAFTATGLPPGIALISGNSFQGSFRGSPLAAGIYPVTLTAINAGAVTTANVIFNVTAPAASLSVPLVTSAASVSGAVGAAFSYTVSVSGAVGASVSGLPDGLSYNAGSGMISGTPVQAGSYPIAVTASNAVGALNATVTLVIANSAPAPAVPLINSSATIVAAVSGTTSAASPAPAYSYQISASNSPTAYSASGLPPGLSFNPNTGLVFGRPSAVGTYRASVTAANSAGTAAAALTFVVPPVSLTLYNAPLELTGSVGGGFSYSIDSSLAAATPYLRDGSSYQTYSASGLPPGLSVNPATGQITGVPARAGNYPAMLSINYSANSISFAITFVIGATSALPAPVFLGAAAILGLAGAPFNQSLQAASAAGYAASGLPAGLSLNPATGAITGVPLAAGVYNVPVSAANAAGSTQATLTIIVLNQSIAPVISGGAFLSATVGQAFGYTLNASSTASPFNITSYAAGNLPAGLSFDAVQHRITGTPTQEGTFVIPVSIASYDAAMQASLTLRVLPASTSAPAPLAKPTIGARAGLLGFVGNPISFSLGTTTPDATDLPSGLSFDAAQSAIAGYPTAAGVSLIDLSASNAVGTAQASLSLRVMMPNLSLPRLVALPISQTVDQGTTVTLAGVAVGIPAPSYQWRRDGAAIPGATASTLTLSNVQVADVGAYTLTATNSSGGVTTTAVSVFIRTTYGIWQSSHFTAQEVAAGLTTATADFNGDGISNLLEYALGRDPRTGLGGSLPSASLSAARDHLQLQFSRDASKTDVGYVVEATSDLLSWSAIASSSAGGLTVNLGGAGLITETGQGMVKTVVVQDNQPVAGSLSNHRFLRLRVTSP